MKKVVFIGLALALVAVMLLPSPTLAAKPVSFGANGIMTYISAGKVTPAGNSGRYVVHERQILGNFLSGDITGLFTFDYKANVEVLTQAGNLSGKLQRGDYVLNVNGKIDPLTFVEVWPSVFLPKLTISGHWNFTKGAHGEGDFTAWAIFIPSPDGHVEQFIASDFTLTGKWQP